MILRAPLFLAILSLTTAAWAEGADPALPLPVGAEETAALTQPRAEFALPLGSWEEGRMPVLTVTGPVSRSAWRLPEGGGDTRAQMEALRTALVSQGFGALFACATDACGGFDFRYDVDFLPEPDMHVDLSDFRYFAAVRGTGPKADYVSLLVSRAGTTGFVELTHIGPSGSAPEPPIAPITGVDAPAQPVVPPAENADLASRLEADGHVILDDLSFASGSADLAVGPTPSLEVLATYLRTHPEAAIAIVGHTDTSGNLGANLALSQKRAQSVVDRLVAEHGANPAQLTAQGAGPLAPVTTNLTEEGRRKNRRVEAVVTSTR